MAVLRSMLRWRNVTGTAFDSAAQARFQDHDAPSPGMGPIPEHPSEEDMDAHFRFVDEEERKEEDSRQNLRQSPLAPLKTLYVATDR